MYHRKEGKVVKERDDVISASRYALMMLRFAMTEPFDDDEGEERIDRTRNRVTGY